MKAFKIKELLEKGHPSIGSWLQIPDTSVAMIIGSAGYDWVAVDLEHGTFSDRVLPDVFTAIAHKGTIPLARLAQAESKDIKKALDAGAHGIILPMIESAEQLEKAVLQSLYPPRGTRGVGYCRANGFGKNFSDYKKAADDILIVAQIENIKAVENLDSILSVKGLDAIMIGPYDLSGSMGLTGQFEHPRYLETLKKIELKAKEHQIPMGLHVVQPDEDALSGTITRGYQFIAYGTDAVFLYNSAQNPITDKTKRE